MQRWWVLPALYVIFLVYQSIAGELIWNCRRDLTNPIIRSFRGASLSDVLANVLAYIPLGFLIAAPKIRPRVLMAFLWAVLLGCVLSVSLESLQRCLPGRVPSSTDVIANTFGAFAGVCLAWAWVVFSEGQLNTLADPADQALQLKNAGLRSLIILACLSWIAYQTAPWVFTFDVGQVRSNFSWLKRLDTHPWSFFAFVRHFAAWFAMLLAWRLSASVRPTRFHEGSSTGAWFRWSLGFMGLALLAQAGLEAKALGPEELLAMLLALGLVLLVSLVLRHEKHTQSVLSLWVALFAFAAVLAYQLEPSGTFSSESFAAKKISLKPLVGTGQLIHALDYALFFAWFGVMCCVAACARPSANQRFDLLNACVPRVSTAKTESVKAKPNAPPPFFVMSWKAGVVAMLVVALTELAQIWIPGRGVDPSPVIFTLLGYLFANRMISRPTPILTATK